MPVAFHAKVNSPYFVCLFNLIALQHRGNHWLIYSYKECTAELK